LPFSPIIAQYYDQSQKQIPDDLARDIPIRSQNQKVRRRYKAAMMPRKAKAPYPTAPLRLSIKLVQSLGAGDVLRHHDPLF
jgi:hypothetical protein